MHRILRPLPLDNKGFDCRCRGAEEGARDGSVNSRGSYSSTSFNLLVFPHTSDSKLLSPLSTKITSWTQQLLWTRTQQKFPPCPCFRGPAPVGELVNLQLTKIFNDFFKAVGCGLRGRTIAGSRWSLKARPRGGRDNPADCGRIPGKVLNFGPSEEEKGPNE